MLEIPEWTTIRFQPDQIGFLYELSVVSPEQQNAPEVEQLLQRYSTNERIGLLFPTDLRNSTFQRAERHRVDVSLPASGVKLDCQLSFLSVVQEELLNEHKLQNLIDFHRVLLDWKNYGVGYHKERDSAHVQEDAAEGATYLIVPLLSSSPLTPSTIDWDLIDREVNQRSTAFLQYRQPLDEVANRYLVEHRKIRYRLLGTLGTSRADGLTAKSKFPTNDGVSADKIAHFQRSYGLDLRSATFAEYFERRYGRSEGSRSPPTSQDIGLTTPPFSPQKCMCNTRMSHCLLPHL